MEAFWYLEGVPPDDPFDPPPNCPECGYALRGLDGGGRCPECGWGMGEAVVYFPPPHGWGYPVMDALLVFYVVMNGVGVFTHLRPFQPVTATGMAAVAAFMVYLLARRWQMRRGGFGPAQARFGPRGFAWREGFGPVRWRPWEARHEPVLTRLKRRGLSEKHRFTLRVKRSGRLPLMRWAEWPFSVHFDATVRDAERLLDRAVRFRRAALRVD